MPPKNLLPISMSDDYKKPVNFYYIKTSYNCCSLGDYVGDYVGLCILEKIISQGVRCFDFEIFNLNNNAIISTSTVTNTRTKETMNDILFLDAMETLTSKAFNSLYCSNYTDPLFINLRMKTNNIDIFNNIASTFAKYDNKYFLNINQSYMYNDNNFCAITPLNSLLNKIIVIVNSSNTDLENSDLKSYVNVFTGPSASNVKQQPFNAIKVENKDELITFNKLKTTFVSPSVSNGTPINPDPAFCFKLGNQFIGMAFQIRDNNLEVYQNFFDEYKHAFIMKNSSLLPNATILNISVPDESSNPNKCNQIKMGDVVVSEFGSGCGK